MKSAYALIYHKNIVIYKKEFYTNLIRIVIGVNCFNKLWIIIIYIWIFNQNIHITWKLIKSIETCQSILKKKLKIYWSINNWQNLNDQSENSLLTIIKCRYTEE